MEEKLPRYANLDEDFEIWRVFQSVQPVFLLDLGWDYEPKSSDSVEAVLEALKFEPFNDYFRADMEDLPRLRPRITLSSSELKLCLRQLKTLLDCLEGFVAAGAIQAAAAGEPPRKHWGFVSAWVQGAKELTSRIFTGVTAEAQKLLGWSETGATQPSPAAGVSGASAQGSSSTTTHKYHRLRALGELFSRQHDKARRWVVPIQPLGRLIEAQKSVSLVRSFFVSLLLPDIKLDAAEVADSKWENVKSREESILLHELVEACTSVCNIHQAKIQLPGILQNGLDELAARDIFLSPCSDTDRPGTGVWRQSHLTRLEESDNTRQLESPIPNLCKYFHQDDPPSQIWNIGFNNSGFYPSMPSKTPRMAGVCGPTMPLSTLVCSGMLQSGGPVTNINKACLALSLGRSLLHLLHTRWVQEVWTTDNINFLYQRLDTEERIYDIHYPFLSCTFTRDRRSIDNDSDTDSGVNLETISVPPEADWRAILWSFAKVLLDIETGSLTRINLQSNTKAIRNEVWGELWKLEREFEPGRQRAEFQNYIQAVHGCVNFAKSLKKYQQRAGRATGDSSDAKNDVRRILYSEVVQNLEMHLNFLRGGLENIERDNIPIHVMKTLQQESGRVWAEGANDGSETATSLPRATFNSELVSADLLRFVHNCTQVPLRLRGNSDGQSSVKQNFEHFLRRYRQFRRRFIVPNMKKDKRRGRERIRIALLDTGLSEQSSDLCQSVIKEVIEYRKSQGFTEDSEAKATDKKNPRYPIKGRKSFIEGKKSCRDTSDVGHGTQLAHLLLKLAPDADLYIAKVSVNMGFEVTEGVVKAIEWAAGPEVKADIITMSFGVSGVSDRLDQALGFVMKQTGVSGHTPLVFASASNAGLTTPGRSHPASDTGRVICAYALDGLGNDNSGLNPPREQHAPNFGTLGHGVKVKWKTEESYASGTSYAAPVLAAITANYLDWLFHFEDRLGRGKQYLWRKDYIERAFKEFMSYKQRSDDNMMFVHPENMDGFKFGNYDVRENEDVAPEVSEADAETSAWIVAKLNRWLKDIT